MHTGYIGGTVLHKLLTHPNAKNLEISAFVRSPAKAKQLEDKFGVRAVVGSYKDLPLLEKHVAEAHVVFNCADADDLGVTNTILKGLKQRHEKTGDLPVLIHTVSTPLRLLVSRF